MMSLIVKVKWIVTWMVRLIVSFANYLLFVIIVPLGIHGFFVSLAWQNLDFDTLDPGGFPNVILIGFVVIFTGYYFILFRSRRKSREKKKAKLAQKKAIVAQKEAEAVEKEEAAQKEAEKEAKHERQLKEMGATNTWLDDTKSGFAVNVKHGRFAYFVDGEMSKIYPMADLLSVVLDREITDSDSSATLTITLNDPECSSYHQSFALLAEARQCEAMLNMALAQAKKNPSQGE